MTTQSSWIEIEENGLHVLLEVTESGDVRLLHMGLDRAEAAQSWPEKKRSKFRLTEIQASGENHDDHHGSKHTGTLPAKRLTFGRLADRRHAQGRRLTVELSDPLTRLEVRCHLQFFDGLPAVRCWTEVFNASDTEIGLEYVSSFACTGVLDDDSGRRDEKFRLSIPHNTWYGEAQWKHDTLGELGLHHVNEFSMKRIAIQSTGTWSTSQYLPMAYLENTVTGRGMVWQIEHQGSWQWELSDIADVLYVQAGGPTEQEHQWWKNLKPGEHFVTVPVSVAFVSGGLESALGVMTDYRRRIRRPNEDNEQLPVIFNDYMNCLFGEPTTEALIPLIDAAAKAGCEYYCIDCGWYSDGYWWDGVGEWLPSPARFPGGIEEVLNHIRSRGMVPGLWLELEVMGTACMLADQVPQEWFFVRHGKRVIDHSRYQLDFRHPGVIEHADRVVQRLVEDYGVGYIKMDYNINAGVGTEWQADSFGDGLLQHNAAYLKWLDRVFVTYPDLVIENCGSGGLRMDYALLSRHSIQSTSDQTDYLKNAVIAAASASAVTPEQAAVWSYPLRTGSREEVVMNMVNTLLLRIHQSGHLAEISDDRFELIREAIAYYKTIRQDLKRCRPFWPLGLPTFGDGWMAFGMQGAERTYLAVWRMGGAESIGIPLEHFGDNEVKFRQAYPNEADSAVEWDAALRELRVTLTHPVSARLYELDL
ncbi:MULTISPECIES: glycoside hydrolase family 36 protein [Saccharibacillus]|uniref:glycoside hydrolase family 36 protein n=1 Tax=Saccharibacillus TaxID=456492 RepID=UPI001239ABF8|nr:glycoside hydrolase family 36 protein [Saccharibacillus sp. WB 17]MWJ33925.1 alpha-galactosidase [Saccharibacillus sp. WB 17]